MALSSSIISIFMALLFIVSPLTASVHAWSARNCLSEHYRRRKDTNIGQISVFTQILSDFQKQIVQDYLILDHSGPRVRLETVCRNHCEIKGFSRLCRLSEQFFPLLHLIIVFPCDFVLHGREFHFTQIDDLVFSVDDEIYLPTLMAFRSRCAP